MSDDIKSLSLEQINPPMTDERGIVDQAKRRFRRCLDWESNAQKLFLDDLRFANADSDNGYQWPNRIRTNRDVDERPCLTINKTHQHNLLIINDARQNKPSIKVRPTGNGATYKSAEVFEGIFRHIEYISNAQAAYDRAVKFQVDAGIGYLRLATDFIGDDSFDQEVFIRSCPDPCKVLLDPDAQEPDKSDSKFGFIFDDIPEEEFATMYPEHRDIMGHSALGSSDGWIIGNRVRVAEYFRCVQKKDRLVLVKSPTTGETVLERESKLPEALRKFVIDDPSTRMRDIYDNEVEWYLIAGDKIIEKTKWPGKYIPIIPVIGEETVINGVMDRKGHTRALKDPQRMLNYWASAATEQMALQSKSPYVAAVAAIENLETYWRTVNRVNHAVLPYNHLDDEGNEIPAPQRQEGPQVSQSYIEGFALSLQQMMEVSGQYQSQFGKPGNEKSGKAINERQRQGDTATYHFIDNLALSIRYLGRQLIDLVPKIYDTERIIRIMGDDGIQSEIVINPEAQQALMEQKAAEENTIRRIFNPSVGRYEVMADVGPAYATKRQEAFNAFSQIAVANPDLMSVIGDLLFRNADFPGADKIAERLERMVPPQAKGQGPSPAEQQMQLAIMNLQAIVEKQSKDLAEYKIKLVGKEQQKDINAYDAITKRLNVLFDAHEITPRMVAEMIHDLVLDQRSQRLHTVSADDPSQMMDAERENVQAAQGLYNG